MAKEKLGKALVKPEPQKKGGTHYRDQSGKPVTEKEFMALKGKADEEQRQAEAEEAAKAKDKAEAPVQEKK